MSKPKAVEEVEASSETTFDEAWKKLKERAAPTDEDFDLLIAASRRERQRWELKQKSKGKEE